MILRYLKSSSGKVLLFKKGKSLDITAYSDVVYASCIDDTDSTTGFCIFVGEKLIP